MVREREAKEVTTMTPERKREETPESRARRVTTTMTSVRARETKKVTTVTPERENKGGDSGKGKKDDN